MKISTKKQARFCRHLASWLYCTEWHFTTLLASCIDVANDLPDDADHLIHDLLLRFKEKPSRICIVDFLESHPLIDQWFCTASTKPKIIKLNLAADEAVIQRSANLPRLNTIADLAEWLNVSTSQLEWLADLKRRDMKTPKRFQHYHYSLAKKRSGRLRLIESPKSYLKGIQKKINDAILVYNDIHPAAQGFVKGRSCQAHASLHVNKSYLFLFDLAHCFQSVVWVQVYSVFMNLGYPPVVSQYLTALCTHQCYTNKNHPNQDNSPNGIFEALDKEQQARLCQRHLPQGAPCSPMLSNIVLHKLDKRLAGLANKLKLDYSRYADDLAFSGNCHRDWGFLEPLVGSICMEEGFVLNHRKSRQARPHQKQRVTGIVVNQKINIDRQYYDQLKATLYNCVRYGLHSQNHGNHPHFKDHLLGCVVHVRSLNKNKGQKLLALFEQIS